MTKDDYSTKIKQIANSKSWQTGALTIKRDLSRSCLITLNNPNHNGKIQINQADGTALILTLIEYLHLDKDVISVHPGPNFYIIGKPEEATK